MNIIVSNPVSFCCGGACTCHVCTCFACTYPQNDVERHLHSYVVCSLPRHPSSFHDTSWLLCDFFSCPRDVGSGRARVACSCRVESFGSLQRGTAFVRSLLCVSAADQSRTAQERFQHGHSLYQTLSPLQIPGSSSAFSVVAVLLEFLLRTTIPPKMVVFRLVLF